MFEALAEFFSELQSGTKRKEPAKGGQGAGHILLLTFLECPRKVSRLAGRNPPVLTFSLELMGLWIQNKVKVAGSLAALIATPFSIFGCVTWGKKLKNESSPD